MERATRHFRANLLGLLLLAVGAGGVIGCSPRPFDATAPWVPMQSGEGRSFSEGFGAYAPSGSGFERFESQGVPAAEVALPGESGGNPWATRPENVVVQICYGRMVNSQEAVKRKARDLCPPNAKLRFLGQDRIFNACPLLQPTRAAYRCLRPDESASESADAS